MAVQSQLVTYTTTYQGMPTTTIMPAGAALTEQDPHLSVLQSFGAGSGTSSVGVEGHPIG